MDRSSELRGDTEVVICGSGPIVCDLEGGRLHSVVLDSVVPFKAGSRTKWWVCVAGLAVEN